MTGSFTNNGDGTITVSFDFTAELEKVQATINNACRHIYHGYPIYDEQDPPQAIPFEDLTNAQKLHVVDRHIRMVIISAARANLVTEAENAAREAALVDDSVNIGE